MCSIILFVVKNMNRQHNSKVPKMLCTRLVKDFLEDQVKSLFTYDNCCIISIPLAGGVQEKLEKR